MRLRWQIRNRRIAIRNLACVAALLLLTRSLSAIETQVKTPDTDPDPDIELASRLERGFSKLAKRVAPSVVSLQVHVKQGTWLEELRRMTDSSGAPMPQRDSKGSGVVVDPDGLIVTNEHVIRGAESIKVQFLDGRTCSANVCGCDPRSDLAMVRLTGDDVPKNLNCATLADSDKVEVGQWVIAVGNPFGLSNTVTLGIVSACGRKLAEHTNFNNDVFYGNLIQTDAAINPGNSGGPLFDMRGHLIGINTIIFSDTGLSQGFGFAIPSNHLNKRLAYLKAGREVEYGWLGVALQDLNESARKDFNVPDDKGVLVLDVIPNTPADRAGLTKSMVILSFDNTRIANKLDLISAVNETPVGRTVKVKALDRQGKVVELPVKISKRNADVVQATQSGRLKTDDPAAAAADLEEGLDDPAEKPGDKTAIPASSHAAKNRFSWRGLQFRELSIDDGSKRGGRIEVTRVKKGSPADRAGLFEGAILTELKLANNPAVLKLDGVDDFRRLVDGLKGPASVNTALDGLITIEEK